MYIGCDSADGSCFGVVDGGAVGPSPGLVSAGGSNIVSLVVSLLEQTEFRSLGFLGFGEALEPRSF